MLLVASAEDRLLPSLTEASRLRRLIPDARRVVRVWCKNGLLPSQHDNGLLHASRVNCC